MRRVSVGAFIGVVAIIFGLMGASYVAGAYVAGSASASTGGTASSKGSVLGQLRSKISGQALVTRALKTLKAEYFAEIDAETEQRLMYAAVQGMLSELRKEPFKDDFSNFYDPELYKELSAQTTGHYAGIGIMMGGDPAFPFPKVVQVFAGSPAEAAGLQTDDVIIEVDGESTQEMILPLVASKVKGEPETKVKMKLIRPDDGSEINVEITRKDVDYRSVDDVKMLDGNVGYIKISNFAETTGRDFRTGMEDLTAKGMKSLIIDLRDNTGGLLEAAAEVADCFIEKGMIVRVDVRGTIEQGRSLDADPNSKKYKLPIVVMINGGSASSSEVLTSALRDYDLARVFGDLSFGKGVVQAVTPMEMDGNREVKSALAITIGKYFTKSGVEIHGNGIEPDLWYNFENELRDDSKLAGMDKEIKAQQDELTRLRAKATKYVRDKDNELARASGIAAKLGRGESVPDQPELKPVEAELSALEMITGAGEDEEKVQPSETK